MINETEPFMEHVRNQKKKRSLSPEREQKLQETYNSDMDKDEAILKLFKVLELDTDCPNCGTRARQSLMKKTIILICEWKTGTYNQWLNRLSLKLHLSVRTVRENYLSPLISEGIIKEDNGQLCFMGVPKESDHE